jgi:hypothetical protein
VPSTLGSPRKGLDQSFNSLHAQREACEAYVTSQRHEGWQVLKETYDDGGFSGGNTDRPAKLVGLSDIGRHISALYEFSTSRVQGSPIIQGAKYVIAESPSIFLEAREHDIERYGVPSSRKRCQAARIRRASFRSRT